MFKLLMLCPAHQSAALYTLLPDGAREMVLAAAHSVLINGYYILLNQDSMMTQSANTLLHTILNKWLNAWYD